MITLSALTQLRSGLDFDARPSAANTRRLKRSVQCGFASRISPDRLAGQHFVHPLQVPGDTHQIPFVMGVRGPAQHEMAETQH